jgi:hypothetical protein
MKHNKDYRPVKNNEKKVIGYIQKVWARDGYMWRTFDIDKNVYYGLGSSPAKKKDAVEFVLNRKE